MNRRDFIKAVGVGTLGLMIDGKIFAEAKGESKMKIQAVKLFENGFMTQPFAMGGEDGVEKFDASVQYRSSLQNYVIDTGKEIILVDTGTPEDFPEQIVDDKTQIFMGNKIANYVDALKQTR